MRDLCGQWDLHRFDGGNKEPPLSTPKNAQSVQTMTAVTRKATWEGLTWSVKCLVHKHGDLSSHPSTQREKTDVAICACNPSADRQKHAQPLRLAGQLHQP